MRIFVIEPDGAGGLLHYAFQMSAALAESGQDVTLVTGRHYELEGVDAPFRVDPRMKLWPAVEPPGARRLAAPLRRIRRVWRGLRYAVEWHRLTRHLLRERPDLIQFSTIRFPIQALFLRRLHRAGLRLSQVCHEFEPREARLGWIRNANLKMATAAYRTFDVIFFHGDGHMNRFRELFDTTAELVMIPHGDEGLLSRLADGGGDLRTAYGLGPDRPVVLFFGGLRPSKGIPGLIRAFALAREQVPDAALVVAGHPAAGFDVLALRQIADETGAGPAVTIDARYLPLSEVGPLVRTATVVVLPYLSGTASGVLQAAYTFDKPVIVTDVGSLAEAVDHGVTGLVVPSGDVAALAAAIAKMLADPGETAAMGRSAGLASRERFGWEPIAARVMDAYGRSS